MRRTGYTRDGVPVRLNFHAGRLTSYRIEGQPLMRRQDFHTLCDFYTAAKRAIRTTPRPKGLPR